MVGERPSPSAGYSLLACAADDDDAAGAPDDEAAGAGARDAGATPPAPSRSAQAGELLVAPHATIAHVKRRVAHAAALPIAEMRHRNLRLGDELVKLTELDRTLESYLARADDGGRQGALPSLWPPVRLLVTERIFQAYLQDCGSGRELGSNLVANL